MTNKTFIHTDAIVQLSDKPGTPCFGTDSFRDGLCENQMEQKGISMTKSYYPKSVPRIDQLIEPHLEAVEVACTQGFPLSTNRGKLILWQRGKTYM